MKKCRTCGGDRDVFIDAFVRSGKVMAQRGPEGETMVLEGAQRVNLGPMCESCLSDVVVVYELDRKAA